MASAQTRQPAPKLDRFTEHHFEPYVKGIGQLVLAWNSLQDALALTFQSLTVGTIFYAADDQGAQIRGAWNAINSDRDRRKMLRAVVAAATKRQRGVFPNLTDDLIWLLNRADELEDVRNNIVHSPLMLLTGKRDPFWNTRPDLVTPAVFMENPRALRLIKTNLLAEFRWCRDSTLVCRDFAVQMNRALISVGYPWPKTPSLPNHAPKKSQSHHKRQTRQE